MIAPAAASTGLPAQDAELQGLPQPPEPDDDPDGMDVPVEATGGDIEQDDIKAHGFVALHRKFQSQWWWEHKPWSYGHMFLWLLMTANHKGRRAEYGGEIIEIPRGAVATSMLAMSERSGLSRDTVKRFISKMEQSGELKLLRCTQHGIVVSVCHYDAYTAVPQRTRQRSGNSQDNTQDNGPATHKATDRQHTSHTYTMNTKRTTKTSKP